MHCLQKPAHFPLSQDGHGDILQLAQLQYHLLGESILYGLATSTYK